MDFTNHQWPVGTVSTVDVCGLWLEINSVTDRMTDISRAVLKAVNQQWVLQ